MQSMLKSCNKRLCLKILGAIREVYGYEMMGTD